MRRSVAVAMFLLISVARPSQSADLREDSSVNRAIGAMQEIAPIKARAAVISGDTLWFPEMEVRVRLDGIETCPLPQWAFDPFSARTPAIAAPVPCGAMAKGWLKRLVGNSSVNCASARHLAAGEAKGRCFAHGRDLALAMLRVGWARTDGLQYPQYLAAERYARSARYGLWGTYVLDIVEWRRKAVDRTTGRRPIADRNLLAERESEFTPPFVDWRNRPRRTDR